MARMISQTQLSWNRLQKQLFITVPPHVLIGKAIPPLAAPPREGFSRSLLSDYAEATVLYTSFVEKNHSPSKKRRNRESEKQNNAKPSPTRSKK